MRKVVKVRTMEGHKRTLRISGGGRDGSSARSLRRGSAHHLPPKGNASLRCIPGNRRGDVASFGMRLSERYTPTLFAGLAFGGVRREGLKYRNMTMIAKRVLRKTPGCDQTGRCPLPEFFCLLLWGFSWCVPGGSLKCDAVQISRLTPAKFAPSFMFYSGVGTVTGSLKE